MMSDVVRSPTRRGGRFIGGKGLMLLALIAIPAAAFIALRQAPSQNATPTRRVVAHPHGHKSAHGGSRAATSPAVLDPRAARDKALRELKESQEQAARMKAQGIGGTETR
jgi:hypothetical protein